MRRALLNTLRLTGKELRSIRADPIMIILIVFVFVIAIPVVSKSISTEIRDVAVAVVDEDHSTLSRRMTDAIQPPLFLPAQQIGPEEANDALNKGRVVLVAVFPPGLEADLRAGRDATVQILVDATSVAHAGNGAAYLQQVLSQEAAKALSGNGGSAAGLADLVFRTRFNPNLSGIWFASVTQLMNNITILTVILAGAALIRERERGTIEHLLVMPVTSHEIVISKIAATGFVIMLAAAFCLEVLIRGLMGVPVAGSATLFLIGTAAYTVSVASLGILLATLASSMAQFGLLVMPVIVVMMLVSGGLTPMESMPSWMQYASLTVSPAPHFISFSQAVLYRGTGIEFVWKEMGMFFLLGAVYYGLALSRFRKVLLNV